MYRLGTGFQVGWDRLGDFGNLQISWGVGKRWEVGEVYGLGLVQVQSHGDLSRVGEFPKCWICGLRVWFAVT